MRWTQAGETKGILRYQFTREPCTDFKNKLAVTKERKRVGRDKSGAGD